MLPTGSDILVEAGRTSSRERCQWHPGSNEAGLAHEGEDDEMPTMVLRTCWLIVRIYRVHLHVRHSFVLGLKVQLQIALRWMFGCQMHWRVTWDSRGFPFRYSCRMPCDECLGTKAEGPLSIKHLLFWVATWARTIKVAPRWSEAAEIPKMIGFDEAWSQPFVY